MSELAIETDYVRLLNQHLEAEHLNLVSKYFYLRFKDFRTLSFKSNKKMERAVNRSLEIIETAKSAVRAETQLSIEDNTILVNTGIAVKDPLLTETELAPEVEIIQVQDLSKIDFELFVAYRFTGLKKSADIRRKDFNLTLSQLKKILSRKKCYYTNRPLTIYKNFGEGSGSGISDNHLTLDRIDCTKGYIAGNVVACSNFANQLKNKLLEEPNSRYYMSFEEFENFYKVLKSARNKHS